MRLRQSMRLQNSCISSLNEGELMKNKDKPLRPVSFNRLADGGLELLIPDDIVSALGWGEDDNLELLFDVEGRLIIRKLDPGGTEGRG